MILVSPDLHAQNWTISGIVVDSAGGPIAGVDLDLISAASPTSVIPISGDTTGLDGSFLLSINTTIPSGQYLLQFEPITAHLPEEITITLNGNLDVGTISLASGWMISGSVIDSAGNPVTTIDIDIRGDQLGWLDLIGDTTDVLGSFSVAIPAIIDEYRIIFTDTALTPTVFPTEIDLGLLFGPTDLGQIVMPTAHTLSGIVVDEDGIALPGMDMNIYDATGTPVDLFNDDTDALGLFNVLVPSGTWTVRHRDVTPVPGIERVTHELIDLPVFENLDLGVIVMPMGYHLQGFVVGSVGEAIAGANFDAEYSISGQHIYVATDLSSIDGSFDLLLPAGNLTLEVDPPATGPVRVSKRITLNLPPVNPTSIGEIVLDDGVNVTGSFADSAGSPVPLVDVEFYLSSNGQLYDTLHENGNQSGTFNAVVHENDYNLTFTPNPISGLGPAYIENVPCFSATDLGVITLNASAELTGLVSSNGVPLQGISILAVDAATGIQPPWGSTTTTAAGTYSLPLTDGNWNVTAVAPAGTGLTDIVETNVAVSAGVVLNFEFPNLAPEVLNLNCSYANGVATLNWTNGTTYDWISIERGGLPLTTLMGDQTSFEDPNPGTGTASYAVIGHLLGVPSPPATCTVSIPLNFIRCDADMGGNITISDAINVLSYLFSSFPSTCLDALDCNDNGTINIADPVTLLNFLFGSAPPPPAPYPNPGVDPTADSLDCN